MRSIVVPVNFTPNAANAARYATDMALALGMDIHLVNVLEMPKAPHKKFSAGVHEELLNSCLELLQKLSAELATRSRGKVRIATDLETGNIHDRLAEFCKTIRPFAIVCGSSEGSMDNLLKGSDTIKRIRQLPYPLLVVPEHTAFHTIRNVLIACDGEDIHTGIFNARPMLETLTNAFSPRFLALHVLVDGETSAQKLAAEFQSWKGILGPFDPAITFIRQPNVAKGIAEYLQAHNTDLLLVLPKKHGWLDGYKSRSREIVSKVVPILSLSRKK